MTHHSWTKEEEQILIKALRDNNGWITKGNKEQLAKKIGVSVQAVTQRMKILRTKANVSKYVKWDKEKEAVIIESVKAYPYNLSLAFADAAPQLNTTVAAVRYRYYQSILPKQQKPLFAFITYGSHMFNHKNVVKHKYKKQKNNNSFWSKLLTLFCK